jgi:hypothetical protein
VSKSWWKSVGHRAYSSKLSEPFMIARQPSSAQSSQTRCMGHSCKLEQKAINTTLSAWPLQCTSFLVDLVGQSLELLAVLVHTNKTCFWQNCSRAVHPNSEYPIWYSLDHIMASSGLFLPGTCGNRYAAAAVPPYFCQLWPISA